MVGQWKGHWPVSGVTEGGDGLVAAGDALLTVQGLTADGVPCGTLSVGDGPPLPPATDPTAPYPPSSGGAGGGPADGKIGPLAYGEFPGHEYPITGVVLDGPRLAFNVPVNEPWRGWCGLQTPLPGETTCVSANGGFSSPSGCGDSAGHPIPCAQFRLCAMHRVCYCDSSCCDADPNVAHVVDLHMDRGAFQGSVDQTLQIFLDPVP